MATNLTNTGWTGDSTGVWTPKDDTVIDSNDGINVAFDVVANTLSGNDFIKGSSDSDNEFGYIAGINNRGTIDTGAGKDTIVGKTKAGTASDDVYGIYNVEGTINTGSGRDTIIGKVTPETVFESSLRDGSGIYNLYGRIDTGSGRDIIIGKATTDEDVDGSGIYNVNGFINTGSGRDTVTGVAMTVGEQTVATGIYNDLGTILTGEDGDAVTGTARAKADGGDGATGATAFGIDNQEASIRTEEGNDTITGTAKAEVFGEGVRAFTIGINNAEGGINSGKGCDTITGTATSIGQDESIAKGILNVLDKMNTETGNDAITGAATAVGKSATAIGIENLGDDNFRGGIIAGEGNDTVTGTATAEGTGNDVFATGIAGGEFLLGDGDDKVIAHACGAGTNLGIDDVLIDGGSGKDTFDIQNGNGTIIGGLGGKDLLILEGIKSDYTFTDLPSLSLGVNITNLANFTNLNVTEVELFRFSEEASKTFTYGELFIV